MGYSVFEQGITSATEPYLLTLKKSRNECRQTNCETGRFGSSVQGLGDIDLDGFEGQNVSENI